MQYMMEFLRRYGTVVDKRRSELKAELDASYAGESRTGTKSEREAYEEFDRLRNFEQDLSVLIRSCVNEAVKPMQDVLLAHMNVTTTAPWRGL